jgi:hexosaminidase
MDDMNMPIKGYYTQEQMRELVSFAAKYHVQVVPEIEMPGHEVAAISVYPELTCHGVQVPIRTTCGVSDELLCPGNEFTYEFLGNVFKELADVFPSPYIHLGGDEAGNPDFRRGDLFGRCRSPLRLEKVPQISQIYTDFSWDVF